MTKSAEKNPEKKTAEKSGDKETAESGPKPTFGESIRETLDSIVIAFILAFLFRTFEAEAFVIPTGSMALTLMGAHKDHTCPECGKNYKIGASGENPEDGDTGTEVTTGVCPNCRYRDEFTKKEVPTYNGDRILVTKYSYDFGQPQRYDVSVFKNPSKAQQNYIKRLIGLPGEEVMVYRGDIYVRKPGEEAFRIARKPADKALAVMQVVYDNDYVLPKLIEQGWMPRWQGDVAGAPGSWKTPYDEKLGKGEAGPMTAGDLKTFRTDGEVTDVAWLRYQHYVPSMRAWQKMEHSSLDPSDKAEYLKPQLITDFCEYNSGGNDFSFLGLHWVGDLAVECELTFLNRPDDGEAVLQLNEGKHQFECRISAKTGDATLVLSERDSFRPTAKGAVSGDGPHRLRFANVDDRLLFWVDDKLVEFDREPVFQSYSSAEIWEAQATQYDKRKAPIVAGSADSDVKPVEPVEPLENFAPTNYDLLSPVAIGASKCELAAAHLRVLRDLYSIADKSRQYDHGPWTLTYPKSSNDPSVSDYRRDVFAKFRSKGTTSRTKEGILQAFMSDVTSEPERWQDLVAVSFQLEEDQFFMMGDNSQQSLDGRLWPGAHPRYNWDDEYFVRRKLLIGKALFVYWPHGWDNVPFTQVKLPPLWFLGNQYNPDFTRMRLIR